MAFEPSNPQAYIGTAGWTIPVRSAAKFAGAGSHLERYAQQFTAVEINSSFYRPHQRKTYERWAATVPANFRFAVKIPKQITHELALRSAAEPLAVFLESATGLGDKLGCLLIQLPPSQQFDSRVARSFFEQLRKQYPGAAVCEPRHATWFEPQVDKLLATFQIGRVKADPAPFPQAAASDIAGSLVYHRLHGSPEIYYSPYSDEYLETLAASMKQSLQSSCEAWCIFDNTALGWAAENALSLANHLRQ